jgi:hypothetical protein
MTVQMITQLTRANAAEFVAAAETALDVANLRWRYLRLGNRRGSLTRFGRR